MCRFTFYMGPPLSLAHLITEPRHSLIHQSAHALYRDEPLNGDGFGLAWYAPLAATEPALFRSITPAWNNRNLLELARVVSSSCILAHVRAATQAFDVSENNCHPFKFGPLAFMHNGDIEGFGLLRQALVCGLGAEAYALIRGSTDSEHFFALVVQSWLDAGRPTGTAGLSLALHGAMETLNRLRQAHAPGSGLYLNLVLTDGRCAVAWRHTSADPQDADSLYLSRGRRYTCQDGVCRMLDADANLQAALIASEPLSDETDWTPLPPCSEVLIENGRSVEIRPLAASRP